MKPYEYTESDGEKLRIEPKASKTEAHGSRATVPRASSKSNRQPLPAAALALYEAAGLRELATITCPVRSTQVASNTRRSATTATPPTPARVGPESGDRVAALPSGSAEFAPDEASWSSRRT